MKNTHLLSAIPLRKIPDFWENLKSESNIETKDAEVWKKKVEFLDEVSLQNNVVVFVLNPYTRRFIYMSDKLRVLSGLDPSLYTAENGFDFSFSRAHPKHLDALIFFNQLAANYFADASPQDYKNISVCLSFLYKNGNDEYVQVLQRTTALEFDGKGQPTLYISIGHYVGHIKKAGSVGLVINAPTGVSIYDYNFDKKCIGEAKSFSEQERKIVLLLAQGDDTKTIAKKLFISPHTVDTHRRNLIRKTGCIDTTAVVVFAKLINLI